MRRAAARCMVRTFPCIRLRIRARFDSNMASSRFTPELIASVSKHIADAQQTGARVAAWDSIKELLVEAALAWIQQCPPEFCGVHPGNRSGQGVGTHEAHNHGRDILVAGFSWSKAADATAFESPVEEQLLAECWEFNKKLSDMSGNMIPPLVDLKLISVSGSHTNTFLRATKAGCPTVCSEIADEHGRLSADKLCMNRPPLKEAIQKGLRWFVLHHECMQVWPGLIDLIQQALNTEARERQNEIEVMLSMHLSYTAQVKAGTKNPNWVQIEKAACFSMPPCSSWVNVLAAYVRDHAGDGELLSELNMFIRAFRVKGGSSRILGSEFFSKLNSLNFGTAKRMPYVMNACIKTNLNAPANKIIDGSCKLLLPGHLAQLASPQAEQRALVDSAEAVMTEGRKLAKALNLDDVVATRVLGKLDVRCILLCTKLGKVGEGKEYASVHDIAEVSSRSGFVLVVVTTSSVVVVVVYLLPVYHMHERSCLLLEGGKGIQPC